MHLTNSLLSKTNDNLGVLVSAGCRF